MRVRPCAADRYIIARQRARLFVDRAVSRAPSWARPGAVTTAHHGYNARKSARVRAGGVITSCPATRDQRPDRMQQPGRTAANIVGSGYALDWRTGFASKTVHGVRDR